MVFQIATFFSPAYFKTTTVGNAIEGFKISGISPFNNDPFSEANFMASNVTERPLDEMHAEIDASCLNDFCLSSF